MVSGKNHTVLPNVLLAQPVPIQVMSCGSAAGAVTRPQFGNKFELRGNKFELCEGYTSM